jgi:hypothetical protein
MEHLNRWAIVENRLVYLMAKIEGGYRVERRGKEYDLQCEVTESFETQKDALTPPKSAIPVPKVMKTRGRKPLFNDDGTRKYPPNPNKGKYGNQRGRPRLLDDEGNPIVKVKVTKEKGIPKGLISLQEKRERAIERLHKMEEKLQRYVIETPAVQS